MNSFFSQSNIDNLSQSVDVITDSLSSQLQKFKIDLVSCQTVNNCLDLLDTVSNSESGIIFQLKELVKTISVENKKILGPILQNARNDFKKLLDQRIQEIQEVLEKDNFETFDPTVCVTSLINKEVEKAGSLHPITVITSEINKIFTLMGFDVFNGNLMQSQTNNFTLVGTPDYHPARGMQDTFFTDVKDEIGENYVLRTQVTSNIINYAKNIAKNKEDFRVVFNGLVFRAENMDATHDINFHQADFWMVGKNYTNSHLFDILQHFLSIYFEQDVQLRFRPSYFPFTQPSFEIDMYAPWFKGGQWIEIAGCGPIRKEVIENMGLDSEVFTGLAAGFGTTRLAQLKLGITNLPQFYNGNLRFSA